MFIGYLKKDFDKEIEELLINNSLFELELLKQSYEAYPQYCFAAYEDNKILAILSAYEFDKHLYVNVLECLPTHNNLIQRLLDLLIRNSSQKDIRFLIKESLLEFIDMNTFKEYASFGRFIYSGEAVAFNFSNSMAKQVTSEEYPSISKAIDLEVFKDNREDYITKDCVFSNSLPLSTKSGFLHSYVVNKRFIRISPWLMKLESFIDAEKLLRGVLYYRGLKKIFAYAPSCEEEIVKLYESYKFKKDEKYKFLYFGEEPDLRLESIYAI